MKKIFFILILVLAIFFRFNNLNWDANFHLHPDERFLTMVGNAMKVPASFSDYLNPQTSTFNPVNIGYRFFVYGIFPLTVNKLLAINLGMDNYNSFTILGRFLSAFADLLTVILVYKTAELLTKKTFNVQRSTLNIPLLATFFYAIAVLPIQLSHFFVTDTFLNFFMFGSFYFALKKNTIFSSIFFGLALASKITALFILPLNLLFLIIFFLNSKVNGKKIILMVFLYFLIAYITLRLSDPYVFQNANFLDPRPNKIFTENLQSLEGLTNKQAWYPPAVQWINKKPIFFSLINLSIFGLGIPYFLLVIFGVFQVFKTRFKAILLWVIGFFLYQSSQFAQTMRYFIFIYPFLAIFGALGIEAFKNYVLRIHPERITNLNVIRYVLYATCLILLLIWPLMFSSIYFNKNSRVTASEWIFKNIPDNSNIATEHWDDGLPLLVGQGKQYFTKQLPVFGPDNNEKWLQINNILKNSDYYILSSNRGWGSIPTVPERYPKMTKFYRDLFAEKLGYKKIAEFTSFPKLEVGSWKLEVDDQWSDESFTVYDHPKVLIFKNTGYHESY